METEERIIEVLGGNKAVGLKSVARASSLREQVRAGFGFASLVGFTRRYQITQEQISHLIDISERTFARRKSERRLTKAESDRLYRVARVAAQAERWLKEANPTLGSASPLSLLDTDEGAQAVSVILGRIEYGVYS